VNALELSAGNEVVAHKLEVFHFGSRELIRDPVEMLSEAKGVHLDRLNLDLQLR